jgi:hypothetical protein
MAGEDRRVGPACGGKAGCSSDGLHVSPDHALRIGAAGRRLECDPVDDIAAIGGQRPTLMRLRLGASGLGELPGNSRHFNQPTRYGGLDSFRHVFE